MRFFPMFVAMLSFMIAYGFDSALGQFRTIVLDMGGLGLPDLISSSFGSNFVFLVAFPVFLGLLFLSLIGVKWDQAANVFPAITSTLTIGGFISCTMLLARVAQQATVVS